MRNYILIDNIVCLFQYLVNIREVMNVRKLWARRE